MQKFMRLQNSGATTLKVLNLAWEPGSWMWEWERASGSAFEYAVKNTMMMNMVPIFLGNNLQLGTYANSKRS